MTEPIAAAEPVRPTRRNALVTWLIPTVCFALAPPLGAALGTTSFRFAPNAAILAGFVIMLFTSIAMAKEINAAAGSSLVGWHLMIPIYGLYWAAVLARKEMATAKRRAGKGEPRNVVLYLLFFLYAAAADLNDLAEPK